MVRVWCLDSHLTTMDHGFVLCYCLSLCMVSKGTVTDKPQRKRWHSLCCVLLLIGQRKICPYRNQRHGHEVCTYANTRFASLTAHAGDGPFSFSGTWLKREKKLSHSVSLHLCCCISFSHTFFYLHFFAHFTPCTPFTPLTPFTPSTHISFK